MAYILFFVSFLLYSLTAANSVLWDENARLMLQSVMLSGDIYRYNSLLILGGKAMSVIPLGTIAFRLNLFSSLFGALSIVTFYSFLVEFMKLWTAYDRNFTPFLSPMAKEKLERFMTIVAFFSSLVFALSNIIWVSSTRFHYHSTNLFLIIMMFFLFIKVFEKFYEQKWMYLFCVTMGVSAAESFNMLIYSAIFFIPLLWVKKNIIKTHPNYLIRILFLFLIGFSLMLPFSIREKMATADSMAIGKVFVKMAEENTGFSLFALPSNLVPFRVFSIIKFFIKEIPLLFLFLALMGFPAALQPRRRFWFPFMFIFIINIVLLSKTYIWTSELFLPAFFTIYSLCALGAFTFFLIFFSRSLEVNGSLSGRLRSSFIPQIILISMIILPMTFQIIRNTNLIYEKNNYLAAEMSKNTLRNVLPGHTINLSSENLFAPVFYLRSVENYRKDINIVTENDSIEKYLPESNKKQSLFLDAASMVKYKISPDNIQPDGLIYKYIQVKKDKNSKNRMSNFFIDQQRYFNTLASYNMENLKDLYNYKNFITIKNDFLLTYFYFGLHKETISEWEETIQKSDYLFDSGLSLAEAYIEKKDYKNAKKLTEEILIANYPDNYKVRILRGKIYLAENLLDKAEKDFITSLKLKNDNIEALLSLTDIYIKLGKFDEAEKQIDKVLIKEPKMSEAVSLKQVILKEKKI